MLHFHFSLLVAGPVWVERWVWWSSPPNMLHVGAWPEAARASRECTWPASVLPPPRSAALPELHDASASAVTSIARSRLICRALAICLLAALTACGSGGQQRNAGIQPGVDPQLSLQDALAQLDQLGTPTGADARAFAQLKAGMRRMLESSGAT